MSFAWAYSSYKEREARISKLIFFANSWTRIDDPWIARSLPFPLPSDLIYYRQVKIQPGFTRAIYSYIITHCRVLLPLSCIQYCSHITSISFCSLTSIYWLNNKITPTLYNHNTAYTTKKSVACYDMAIDSTSKTG